MFCKKCGAELKETQKFCVKCGTRVETGKPQSDATRHPDPVAPSSTLPPLPVSAQATSPPTGPQPEPPRTTSSPSQTTNTVISSPGPSARETTQAMRPIEPRPAPIGMASPSKPIIDEAVPATGAPKQGNKQLRWMWIGVAIVLLAAGGVFAYVGLHGRKVPVANNATTQTSPLGKQTTSGAGTPNANGTALPVLSSTAETSEKNTLNSTAVLPTGDIRKVDFRNFDYDSDILRETAQVKNGEWRDPKNGNEFSVSKVVYGDLKGDGGQEAAVLTVSDPSGFANLQQAELFIFGTSSSGPKLLQTLSSSSDGHGVQGGWNFVTDVKAAKGQIEVMYPEGHCYACEDWLVTAKFRWNGRRFVQVASERKPFKAQSAGMSAQIATNPKPVKSSVKASSPPTWGFGKAGSVETNTPPTQTVSLPPNPVTVPPPHPPASQRATVEVPSGTAVEVQTIDPIDTGVNHMGDILRASLASPIIVGSQIVVASGADVYIRVFEVHADEHKGRPAELRLVLDHLVYRGQSYSLASSSSDMFGTSHGKRNAEVTGGITRGQQVQIAPGAEMSFQLIQPLDIALLPGTSAR